MLDYRAALDCLLASADRAPVERVALLKSEGRVLADAVTAPWDLPRFDNSSMDGFAVVAADLAAAGTSAPVSLPIVGESAAGHAFGGSLELGEAIRISTGAEVPPGADAIVPIEVVHTEGERAVFVAPARPGQFIRRRGTDVTKGQALLGCGTVVTPGVLSMLAFYNTAEVLVFRRPRVGVLTSGDEIVAHGGPLSGSSIVGSSIYYLEAELNRCGCEARLFGVAKDSVESFVEHLERMIEWADILVTTAGVSVGEHDIVGQALGRFHATTHFWRVAVRPGKPFLFATVEGKPFFGFPGNPVSTCCNTEIFLKPFLRRVLGIEPAVVATRRARLAAPCPRDKRRLFFVYTKTDVVDGGLQASPIANQNSGNLLLPAMGNALAVVEPGEEEVGVGEVVEVVEVRVGL